jgi:hypothetical protein
MDPESTLKETYSCAAWVNVAYPRIWNAWMASAESRFRGLASCELWISEHHPEVYKEWLALRDLQRVVGEL